MVVVGGHNSGNTTRLAEICTAVNPAHAPRRDRLRARSCVVRGRGVRRRDRRCVDPRRSGRRRRCRHRSDGLATMPDTNETPATCIARCGRPSDAPGARAPRGSQPRRDRDGATPLSPAASARTQAPGRDRDGQRRRASRRHRLALVRRRGRGLAARSRPARPRARSRCSGARLARPGESSSNTSSSTA